MEATLVSSSTIIMQTGELKAACVKDFQEEFMTFRSGYIKNGGLKAEEEIITDVSRERW